MGSVPFGQRSVVGGEGGGRVTEKGLQRSQMRLGLFPVFAQLLSLGLGYPVGCASWSVLGPPAAPSLRPSPPGTATSHLWREGLSSPGSGPGPGASGLRLKKPLLEEILSSPQLPT